MSLAKYKKKRSFDATTEPLGGAGNGKELRFVIQKHAASHLHYDFRLEMGGVLKSWAVPKGPSTDPKTKRLAMMVEDHPFDYKDFEGIIPAGEYGGGTVIVWDEGTYEALEAIDKDLKGQEQYLLKELKKGSVKVILHGKKLKGEFALVKTKGMGENAWLLIKHNDKYASADDITTKDKSVVSKKTIEQVTKSFEAETKKNTAQKDIAVKIEKKIKDDDDEETVETDLKAILKKADKQTFYTKLKPMLATLVTNPVDDEHWLYEIKWDGYRAVAFKNKAKLELKSRNENSYNEKFFPIYKALREMKLNAVLDGEIIVVNDKGTADFSALQNWKSEADGDLMYYVFDILWFEGYDLKNLSLTIRKQILEKVIEEHPLIRISKHFNTSGTEFLAAAVKLGLEGVIAKHRDSTYDTNHRSNNWLKIKANKRQEVVIGGFTKNDDTSKPFSSLLVGVFDKEKLVYTGKIGTGFTVKQQKELLLKFEKLIVEKPAFSIEPDINKPNRFRPNPPKAKATWLKPELICEVNFTEMTNDGVMRHPSFAGMRTDKEADEVVLEKAKTTSKVVKNDIKKDLTIKTAKNEKTFLNNNEETQGKNINGNDLKFTNLSKIYWPKEKITKRDLINYYEQVSPFILPYLKNRPQSLNRFPNGIKEQSFYQKDVTGKVPDWTDLYLYHSGDSDEDKHFLLGNNKATLLYMVGLGCIEINPWSSTIKKPDHPTWCIIDLDPAKNTFDQVIEAALVTKDILDDMGVPSYCKTSGSTGLHIYIPLGAKYTYDQSKEFAKIIVTLVHQEIPKYTSLERAVKDRGGKMYLDFLQNRAQATLAAPYAVRPKPGATVSMPLAWDEVKKGLKMKDFHIFNAIERIKSVGDIFKPVLGKGIDLKKIISKLNSR